MLRIQHMEILEAPEVELIAIWIFMCCEGTCRMESMECLEVQLHYFSRTLGLILLPVQQKRYKQPP